MSRIGKLPVAVPSGVDVALADHSVSVTGPKGQLSQHVLPVVDIALQDGQVVVTRKRDDKPGRSAHGLTRTLISNMIEGVTKGFRKSLTLQGVGYRVNKAGEVLNFSLGYSHPVTYAPPAGISFTVEGRQAARRPGGGRDSRPAAARALQGQGHPLQGRGRPQETRQGRQGW
jgi:large subunit ribosomal protein L6